MDRIDTSNSGISIKEEITDMTEPYVPMTDIKDEVIEDIYYGGPIHVKQEEEFIVPDEDSGASRTQSRQHSSAFKTKKMANWTCEQVFHLIGLIKERPALYDVNHPSYKLRHVRLKLLNECRDYLQSIRFNTSVEDVKKKWTSLRHTYIMEKRKVENSVRSGIGSETLYTPSLFYFNEMRFLEDSIDARASVSTYNPQEGKSPSHDFLSLPEETYLISTQGRLLREEIDQAPSEPPPSPLGQPSRKRKREDTMACLAKRISKALQTTANSLETFSTIQMNSSSIQQEDEIDRYIKIIGDRLREYEEPERSLIQTELDEVFVRHLHKKIAESKSD